MSIPNSIPEFYSGRSVLITGGTGFMGKVLIEKLLRSCSNISKIYLLVRPKKNVEGQQRIRNLTSEKLFDRLRITDPSQFEKLIPIQADIMSPNLGMSDEDIKIIKKKVSIIFHSAATVKFNEHLRTSIQVNVGGTMKLLKIAHEMPNLVAFIHVSTAYSNCDRLYVEEKIYPMKINPQKLIDSVEWMDDEMVNTITPQLLGDKPNTYTLTKAMAETLLEEKRGDLPVIIVRPSIVTCGWREPVPGWIDNYNTYTGLLVAFQTGVLRTGHVEKETITDIIPVDMAVNFIICSAWYCAYVKPSEVQIYNITSSESNPFYYKYFEIVNRYVWDYPLDSCYRCPGGTFKSSEITNLIHVYLDHYLPALCYDIFSKITRISFLPPRWTAMGMYRRLDKTMDLLGFFAKYEWKFSNSNQKKVSKAMNIQDLQEFHFDVRSIEWTSYIRTYMVGIKQFLLKEDMKNLPKARRNLKLRYAFSCAAQAAAIICMWKLVSTTSTVESLYTSFMNLFYYFVTLFTFSQ